MKKALFCICLICTMLLGSATAYASSPDSSAIPDTTSNLITQPIQLLYLNPQTAQLEEVDFIEPDFETPPENYLYEITARYEYTIHFQLPTNTNITANSINISYSRHVPDGDLGTIEITCNSAAQAASGTKDVSYYGILKFVATGELNLTHTNPTIDDNNILSFKLMHNSDPSATSLASSAAFASIHITGAATSQNLYTTDLTDYLYPPKAIAFRNEKWNTFASCKIHQGLLTDYPWFKK